jgi:hypothetical protein
VEIQRYAISVADRLPSPWVAQDHAASFFHARARAILVDPRRLRLDRLASRGLGWPCSDAQFVDSEAKRSRGEARAWAGSMALALLCVMCLLRFGMACLGR